MLRDLTIQNYRCFEDFHLDGLERVNLFVGNNNSGKTSLLEAIYLLVSEDKYTSLIEISAARGEIVEEIHNFKRNSNSIQLSKRLTHVEPVEHFFYGHRLRKEHNIRIVSDNKDSDVMQNFLMSYTSTALYVSSWIDDKEHLDSMSIDLLADNTFNLKERPLTNHMKNAIYISDKKENIEQMVLIWDDIYLTDKENKVVQALRILEPKIERIGFFKQENHNVARLKMIGYDRPIPISSMGEGIHRILNLSMALTETENSVLLVDEIETGLHYEAQTDMWRLILETAKELNVQVFATTHSWDCIAAYQEALSQVEDSSMGKLFRLDSKYGKLRAVEYDAEDLDIAVRNSIEVR